MTFARTRPLIRLTCAAAALSAFAACGEEPSSPSKSVAPSRSSSTPSATLPAAREQPPAVAEEKKMGGSASERDAALARRVKEALLAKPDLKGHGIDITARGGAVTLFGTADSLAHRKLAEDIASGIDGVKSVENKLVIASGS